MPLRLTPKEPGFYPLFAELAGHLVTAARDLSAMLSEPPNGRQLVADRVRDLEHDADEATHQIIRKVNSSFVTPFDRDDIHGLASRLDDCMDFMDDAAQRIVLYRLDRLPGRISDQVQILGRMADVTSVAMTRLRDMRDLESYWIEINRLENQADEIYRQLLAEVFNTETDAIRVLKLKEVIDGLEAAADAFEAVAHKVESIAVKES